MHQTDGAGVVERYLACLAVHDWSGLAATIADEDQVCYVELTETFDGGGTPTEYPECFVFEQNPDGLINRVSVFITRVGN